MYWVPTVRWTHILYIPRLSDQSNNPVKEDIIPTLQKNKGI